MVGATTWVCLDLVNTDSSARGLNTRGELLRDYFDDTRWLRHEGLINDVGARRLLEAASRRQAEAAAAHQRILDLRRALYGLFSRVARSEKVTCQHLQPLNAALVATTAPLQLTGSDDGYQQYWLDPRDDLSWPLGPIARSAASLLTSADLDRLKTCPGSPDRSCGFVFLDETKNHNRRWCSGDTCGNRTRLHRHRSSA